MLFSWFPDTKGHIFSHFSRKRFFTALLQNSVCKCLGCTVVFASGCVVKLYLWNGCEWSSARTKLVADCQSMPKPAGISGTVLLGFWKWNLSCNPMWGSNGIYWEYCQYLSLMSTFFIFPPYFLQGGPFTSLLLSRKKSPGDHNSVHFLTQCPTLLWRKVRLHGQCGEKGSDIQYRWGGADD